MISVIVDAPRFGNAVVDHVGVGETMGRVLAMAEGHLRLCEKLVPP